MRWYQENRQWWEPLKETGGAAGPMSRWLITGAGGMLGRDLLIALAACAARTSCGLARRELDITDGAAVRAALRRFGPMWS